MLSEPRRGVTRKPGAKPRDLADTNRPPALKGRHHPEDRVSPVQGSGRFRMRRGPGALPRAVESRPCGAKKEPSRIASQSSAPGPGPVRSAPPLEDVSG